MSLRLTQRSMRTRAVSVRRRDATPRPRLAHVLRDSAAPRRSRDARDGEAPRGQPSRTHEPSHARAPARNVHVRRRRRHRAHRGARPERLRGHPPLPARRRPRRRQPRRDARDRRLAEVHGGEATAASRSAAHPPGPGRCAAGFNVLNVANNHALDFGDGRTARDARGARGRGIARAGAPRPGADVSLRATSGSRSSAARPTRGRRACSTSRARRASSATPRAGRTS